MQSLMDVFNNYSGLSKGCGRMESSKHHCLNSGWPVNLNVSNKFRHFHWKHSNIGLTNPGKPHTAKKNSQIKSWNPVTMLQIYPVL